MTRDNNYSLIKNLPDDILYRFHENTSLDISMENGVVVFKDNTSVCGINASVRRGHNYFSASSAGITTGSVTDTVGILRSLSSDTSAYINIPPLEEIKGEYITPGREVGYAERIEFMHMVDDYLTSHSKKISSRYINVGTLSIDKHIVYGDVVDFRTRYMRWSITVSVMAETDSGDTVSCDALMSGEGTIDSEIHLPETLRNRLDSLIVAVEKKRFAKKTEAGEKTCILGPDPACMLVHEAVGHTTEGDMVLSVSAAMRLYGEKVASDIVSLGDYALEVGGKKVPQPLYVDDEGVRTRDAEIIKNGVLSGYMHDRDSALVCGTSPTGNGRAFAYSDTPIIRMRNTCILPRNNTLEEMISSVDDGLYLVQAGMGQADTTGEFMISIVEGYEIKNGKIGDAILDTVTTGKAFEMMKTVDMIGDTIGWDVGGLCGKGQPMITAAGSPPLRCRITIGG